MVYLLPFLGKTRNDVFALFSLGPSAGIVVVYVHTRRVYNHTGYYITIYFRSEVIVVRTAAENDDSNSFNLESPKLALLVLGHTFPVFCEVVLKVERTVAKWCKIRI